MNNRIMKTREDIGRTEERIESTKEKLAELQQHLKVLKAREIQLENEEIISEVRSMLDSGYEADGDILTLLSEIQEKLKPDDATENFTPGTEPEAGTDAPAENGQKEEVDPVYMDPLGRAAQSTEGNEDET